MMKGFTADASPIAVQTESRVVQSHEETGRVFRGFHGGMEELLTARTTGLLGACFKAISQRPSRSRTISSSTECWTAFDGSTVRGLILQSQRTGWEKSFVSARFHLATPSS